VKVMITGAEGQLGRSLRAAAPSDMDCLALTRTQLDITDRDAVVGVVSRLRPSCVINAAAYTAVDRAEEEPRNAFAVNCDGVAYLANAARAVGARLVHVSTDYVFDGCGHRPYRPEDTPHPINVYGASKLAGEQRLIELLPDRNAILRTSWLYALPGNNFVATMLRLFTEKPEVRVVCDQIGSPTAAVGLAEALWRLVALELCGLFHWADAGVASWYDFAIAVHKEAATRGIVSYDTEIIPIPSTEFPTAAKRPSFSVLDIVGTVRKLGMQPMHWQRRLNYVLGAACPTGS